MTTLAKEKLNKTYSEMVNHLDDMEQKLLRGELPLYEYIKFAWKAFDYAYERLLYVWGNTDISPVEYKAWETKMTNTYTQKIRKATRAYQKI
jgi:uncharacterized protein YecT (DUF1311 family)